MKNIREQFLRIAGSLITIESDDGVHTRGHNTQILEDWNLWIDPRDPNQGSFMESELVLTPSSSTTLPKLLAPSISTSCASSTNHEQ